MEFTKWCGNKKYKYHLPIYCYSLHLCKYLDYYLEKESQNNFLGHYKIISKNGKSMIFRHKYAQIFQWHHVIFFEYLSNSLMSENIFLSKTKKSMWKKCPVLYRDQAVTCLVANLCQDINIVSSFSRCLNGIHFLELLR